MPIYQFFCKKCDKNFDELCSYEENSNNFPNVRCPHCKAKKVEKLVSACSVSFTNPGDTSKWDSFSYRAGFNMDKAKTERRIAEKNSHMGGTKRIYGEE